MFTLPWPPSANRIWRNVPGKGTLKSSEYRTWLAGAMGAIAAEARKQPSTVKGRFHVAIVADRPDRRRRDLDNLAKPILDALTASAVIEDDHLAATITLAWSEAPPAKPGRIHVSVVPA
jgi:crossover junction endodeoxyribonuclease RusA